MPSPLVHLLERIAAFQQAQSGSQVWISARNLDSGARFALAENEKVRTASTIKLPIMCATYQGVAEGRWTLDEMRTLHDADKVSGSGIIREFSDGTKLSIRDLIHVMIVVSDNTATNLILDRVTADLRAQAAPGFEDLQRDFGSVVERQRVERRGLHFLRLLSI